MELSSPVTPARAEEPPRADVKTATPARDGNVWRVLGLAAVLVVALLLLVRLSSFGIWDPWELNPADEARRIAAGDRVSLDRPPLPAWLVAQGFRFFGVREWAGRLPIVLCGIACVALVYLLVRRFSGPRAGTYAALACGTSPLFLFNARQMLGDAPAFAAQAFVGLAAASAVMAPVVRERIASAREASNATYRWLGALLAAVLLAIYARGAMLGALPPLLAVTLASALDGTLLQPRRDPRRAIAAYAVTLITVVLGVLVVRGVIADAAEYSPWIGGEPHGGTPPTFELGFEQLFHSFAPWSTILPLAIGVLLVPFAARPDVASGDTAAPQELEAAAKSDPEPSLRRMLLLWAAFAYGLQTLFLSRYGAAAYPAVAALAAAVALFLRDVDRSGRPWLASGLVIALLAGLVLRDFALYPGGPIDGLAITEVTVPEVFNPKIAWAAVIVLFAVAAVLGLGVTPERKPLDVKAPYRLVVAQWHKSLPNKLWLGFIAFLLVGLLVFGVISFVAADAIGLTTLVARVGKRLFFVPIVLPIAVAGFQAVIFAFQWLGAYRLAPLLVAGAIAGGYAAQGYLPALSAHFSPREVYDTYNSLARRNEPLAEYRVGGRAAAYYARGQLREISNQSALIEFLAASDRRWAAFPTDELPALDRAFRRRTNRHLFVADARSARIVLATNQAIAGTENQNFVARFVRERPPARIQHPTHAMLEDKIEFLGYDLELPHGSYVGAGESFQITWYFRCLRPVPGAYQLFVHIDGAGNRLNGDHEPVDKKYPVRLWDQGDVVIDTQQLSVPANYRPGPYTIFMGFYSGETRLRVVQGPKDDADRIRAGILEIR